MLKKKDLNFLYRWIKELKEQIKHDVEMDAWQLVAIHSSMLQRATNDYLSLGGKRNVR